MMLDHQAGVRSGTERLDTMIIHYKTAMLFHSVKDAFIRAENVVKSPQFQPLVMKFTFLRMMTVVGFRRK